MPKNVRQFYSASSLARGFCVWGKLCVYVWGGKSFAIVFHVTWSFKYFCRIAWLWLHTQKLCDDDEVNGTRERKKFRRQSSRLNWIESQSQLQTISMFLSRVICALCCWWIKQQFHREKFHFHTSSVFFLHPSKYYTHQSSIDEWKSRKINWLITDEQKTEQNRIQQLGTLLKDVNYCKVQLSGQTTLSQEWDEIHHTESELRTWQGIENSPPEKHFMSSSEAEREMRVEENCQRNGKLCSPMFRSALCHLRTWIFHLNFLDLKQSSILSSVSVEGGQRNGRVRVQHTYTLQRT